MKKTLLFILTICLLLLGANLGKAQGTGFALVKDSLTGKYGYEEIIEFPGKSKAEVKKRIRALVTEPNLIILENEDELVLRYQTAIASFRYVRLTERYAFKEGKCRWLIEDMDYVFNVSSASQFQPLDQVPEKQLQKIIPEINKIFGKGRENMMKKLAIQSEDW